MGKNSRSRRAAKQKRRAARSSSRHRTDDRHRHPRQPDGASARDGSGIDTDELIEGLIEVVPARLRAGDQQFVDEATRRLAELPQDQVRRAVAAELRRTIPALWSGGWQPLEVIRQAKRTSTAAAGLARAAVAADHDGRRSSAIDPRWAQQLDELGLPAVPDPNRGSWVGTWARAAGLDRADELTVVFDLLLTLRSLPRLETLIPPPGERPTFATGHAGSARVDRAVLDRVRSLLVKAESTTFQAEADAFTAKAHELMTRHAIDAAVLDAGGSDPSETPTTVRIAIDDPYVDAKSLLLQEVARTSRCRTVFHTNLAMSSVVGFPADIAATELLYTSLLVQAQTALTAEARRTSAGHRSRSRGYRSAFLTAFAVRIGQRLDEVNASVVAEAESTTGRSVLPALRSRQSTVDDAVGEWFGGLTSHAVRGGSDPLGWVDGRFAADRAKLNSGHIEGASAKSA